MQNVLPQSWLINPFMIHLRRKPANSFRQAVWLASFLAIFWLGLGAGIIYFGYYDLLEFGWWVGWIIYLAVPLILAVAGAILTQQEIQVDQYQLVYITPLTEKRIVWGYIFMTLYRMRFWIALMVGSLPLLVLSAFYKFTKFSYQVAYRSPVKPSPLPTRADILILLMAFSSLLMVYWFVSILSAVAGVSLTLRFRQSGLAGVAALLTMSSGLLVLLAPLLIAFAAPIVLRLALLLCAPSGFLLFVPLFWVAMYRMGQQWVRVSLY